MLKEDSKVKYQMKKTIPEDGYLVNVALCHLVYNDQHFRGAYCLHHQGDQGSKLF
jgi:hypothetical protein